MTRYILLILLIASMILPGMSASLICDGVIGNTGEQGSGLMRVGRYYFRGHNNCAGMGVAYDRVGTLWSRVDDRVLARLSLDGRLLAQYPIRAASNKSDQMALVGDVLVLLLGNELYALPITAPAGTAPTDLKIKAKGIATNALAGELPVATGNGVQLLNPLTGAMRPWLTVPDADQVELDNSGAAYVVVRAPNQKARMHKYVKEAEVTTDWPKPWGYSRLNNIRIIDEALYACGDGFLSRMDLELNPDPGTVLGMQGTTVIGIGGEWHPEINGVRGITRLWENRYAISGGNGHVALLEWQDDRRQMHIVGHIASLPSVSHLALNAKGQIYVANQVADWSMPANAMLAKGPDVSRAVSRMTRMNANTLVMVTSWSHGGSAPDMILRSGDRLQSDDWRPLKLTKLPDSGANPAVVYRRADGPVLLVLKSTGEGQTLLLKENGRFRDFGFPVTLITTTPIKSWNDLTMKNPTTLLATGDGIIVECAMDGDNWKEVRRWNVVGEEKDMTFGTKVYLAVDGDNMLIADRERHRVFWVNLATNQLLGMFGTTDTPRNDLEGVTYPELVAVNGNRAVVYDSANQRVIKLLLQR